MRFERQLQTTDNVSLDELFDYAVELLDMYAEAERPFRNLLGRSVDSRTFKVRTGDMTWHEAAEGEHARTGKLSSESMAFSIKKFQRSLGYTKEFIEDNPSEIVRAELDELVKGAAESEFEETFRVMDNGIANGESLWTTPPSPGANDFGPDHNHVFVDTNHLFGDTNAHSAADHIARAATELQHHKYKADVAFVSPEFAYQIVRERTDDMSYYIPEAEGLRTTALPEITLNVAGVNILQTAELTGDEFYLFSTDQKPMYYHTVRPVTLATGEVGAPVGDPAQLIGSYGSTRWGVKMVNPWAGVKVTPDNIA